MTSEIPVARLVHYQRNQESCGKRAIILKTMKEKLFCADPQEKWVQKAMEHLDRKAAALAPNGGTFEKQIGVGEPRTSPATRGMDWSEASETKFTSDSRSKEMGPTSAHTDAFMGPGSVSDVFVVPVSSEAAPSTDPLASGSWTPKVQEPIHATVDPQRLGVLITPIPDSQAATRRQAVGLLAFLGLLFCLGVAMFAYQSLQGCPRKMAGDMVEGLRYVPRSCGSNSYVLVPV
ncbi:hypothetical protein E2I00_014979 [Balaenoptera physalus]|uniref:Chemokine interleukin-8-like domain-containing protein n=1 Tax=Balaenoptera physalus TaxID=9770 RepID=A0A643BYW4_BALPH|nr:hypothetical protein E2I00_014979 [Balaenoptera physalus]